MVVSIGARCAHLRSIWLFSYNFMASMQRRARRPQYGYCICISARDTISMNTYQLHISISRHAFYEVNVHRRAESNHKHLLLVEL